MRWCTLFALGPLAVAGCDFDTNLAPQVELAVRVDSDGVRPLVNDLGYAIELERCRTAIETIEFTTDGEMHADASLLRRAWDLAIPTAYAHPGHAAGGEVVGELVGNFVFDWRDEGATLGMATMLEADYSGANFTFGRAEPGRNVPAGDPMIGHTFDIAGEATLEGKIYSFDAIFDEDHGRRVVGIPFDLVVDGTTDTDIGLSLAVTDPIEEETIFDGIDFAALDEDGDGHIVLEPGTEAVNRLRRNLQLHDHYLANADF